MIERKVRNAFETVTQRCERLQPYFRFAGQSSSSTVERLDDDEVWQIGAYTRSANGFQSTEISVTEVVIDRLPGVVTDRSEERRGGKECRSRWSAYL